MSKQQTRKPKKAGSSGSHQVNWLWGKASVFETIEAKRWRIYELFVTAEVLHQHKDLLKPKQKEGVELEIVSETHLNELVKTTDHQGIVARVSKYPYALMDQLLQQIGSIPVPIESGDAQIDAQIDAQLSEPQSGSKRLQPLVVLLDRIQDATVFAGILRCCEIASVHGVVVGTFCQALVTPQLARTSSGAVNHFPIVQSDNLTDAARSLKELGLSLIVTDSQGGNAICDVDLNVPVLLLIGSDTLGIAPELLEMCDLHVGIPTLGKLASLPPALNASVILYEARRQQR